MGQTAPRGRNLLFSTQIGVTKAVLRSPREAVQAHAPDCRRGDDRVLARVLAQEIPLLIEPCTQLRQPTTACQG